MRTSMCDVSNTDSHVAFVFPLLELLEQWHCSRFIVYTALSYSLKIYSKSLAKVCSFRFETHCCGFSLLKRFLLSGCCSSQFLSSDIWMHTLFKSIWIFFFWVALLLLFASLWDIVFLLSRFSKEALGFRIGCLLRRLTDYMIWPA